MKFNEKLIELRKKEGLSQEELGYKLNVTRQTISKWELGQTTPEMDKLIEMSKLFNMSVDELINEENIEDETKMNSNPDPIIEEKKIVEDGTKNNKIRLVIIGALIIVVILIIIKLISGTNSASKNPENEEKNIFQRFFGMFSTILDLQEDMIGNASNMIGDATSTMNIAKYNGSIESYKGSTMGASVKRLIDEVITINKKEERKITVIYKETKTQDPEEIKNLKTNFDDFDDFEISFEYDEEGYIYEAKIENAISDISKSKFNSGLEMYSGTESGISLKKLLDNIITSNKTEERKVTVKHIDTETQDTEEIKNLKNNVNESHSFEVSFEYDEEGFINKAIFERVVTQFEINMFNATIETLYTGTQGGLIVSNALDKVITSNKTEENKITVKYGNTETQDENEIRKIKQSLNTFSKYEVYVEYDEIGFINKLVIE